MKPRKRRVPDRAERQNMRMTMPKCVSMTVLCAIVLSATVALAEMGPAVPAHKKLIAWACDQTNTDDLRLRITEIEQMPFDGIMITVYPDEYRQPGVPCTRVGRYTRFFSGKEHRREDFDGAIANLKATRFTRLTDNFMDIDTTSRYEPKPEEANLDWFDDRWSVIANNAAVAAYVAREGGLKGFFVDIEAYPGGIGPWGHPFRYEKYVSYMKEAGKTPRSLDEYVTQVRKRGRQFMESVTAVYPGITIVMIQDTGWAGGPLVKAFVEGMLEVRGKAKVMDGARIPPHDTQGVRGYQGQSRKHTRFASLQGHGVPDGYLVGLQVLVPPPALGQQNPGQDDIDPAATGTGPLQRIHGRRPLCLGLFLWRLSPKPLVAFQVWQ